MLRDAPRWQGRARAWPPSRRAPREHGVARVRRQMSKRPPRRHVWTSAATYARQPSTREGSHRTWTRDRSPRTPNVQACPRPPAMDVCRPLSLPPASPPPHPHHDPGGIPSACSGARTEPRAAYATSHESHPGIPRPRRTRHRLMSSISRSLSGVAPVRYSGGLRARPHCRPFSGPQNRRAGCLRITRASPSVRAESRCASEPDRVAPSDDRSSHSCLHE